MQRLLIVKTSSLGDLFHALPAVHSIRRGWGTEVQIDWVVNIAYAPVVACFGDVAGVIGFPRKGTAAQWSTFKRALREKRYDLVVDLQGLMKSALISRLVRAERRVGPSFCREGAHALYRETAVARHPARHAVEQCLDTVRFLDLEVSPEPPPLQFPEYPMGLQAPVLAVAPASRWPSKDWPPEQFIAALNHLRRVCRVSVVFVGGPAERPVCERIAAGLSGQALNLAGRTSLVEACAVLSQADLLLSVDSGPVHIAAASGTPVLGLYGPTDPGRTGPYGPGHRVIRAPGAEGLEHRAFRRKTPEVLSIMARIDPMEVARTLEEMLAMPARLP